jgi:hypothetical protein
MQNPEWKKGRGQEQEQGRDCAPVVCAYATEAICHYHPCRPPPRSGRRHISAERTDALNAAPHCCRRQHQGRAPGPDRLLAAVQAQN